MAEPDKEWGFKLDLTEADVIAHLKTARFMAQPSLWGHTWGRPGDEYYPMQNLTFENNELHVDFTSELALTVTRPQGLSLWRDRLHFGIFGSDLARGFSILIIEKATSVRWKEGSKWLVEFRSAEGGGFELREMKGERIFWQNYIVPGKPAFSSDIQHN